MQKLSPVVDANTFRELTRYWLKVDAWNCLKQERNAISHKFDTHRIETLHHTFTVHTTQFRTSNRISTIMISFRQTVLFIGSILLVPLSSNIFANAQVVVSLKSFSRYHCRSFWIYWTTFSTPPYGIDQYCFEENCNPVNYSYSTWWGIHSWSWESSRWNQKWLWQFFSYLKWWTAMVGGGTRRRDFRHQGN